MLLLIWLNVNNYVFNGGELFLYGFFHGMGNFMRPCYFCFRVYENMQVNIYVIFIASRPDLMAVFYFLYIIYDFFYFICRFFLLSRKLKGQNIQFLHFNNI